MTPKDLRKRVSRLISATPGLPPLDKPTIDELYFDAAIKAAELVDVPALKATLLIDLVAGQKDYLVTDDLLEFVDIQWFNQITGYYETLSSVELSTLSQYRGNELVYAHAGKYRTPGADFGKNILRLSAAPSESLTGGILVSYRLKPTRLELIDDAASIIDFPDNVQALIPYQIAFYFFGQQGAKPIKDLGANYGQYFDNECRRINGRLGEQQQRDNRRQISTDWGGMTL